MWEKISKVKAQVIACMIIISCSFGLAFWAAAAGIPKSAELLINKVTDIALVGVVGWLFTSSKSEAKIH